MRRTVLVLATLLLATGCESDWTCPTCTHDANVKIEDAAPYVGKTAHVVINSAGGRQVSASGVLLGPELRFTFPDFIREGGGPYDTLVYIDLNGDGGCDNPPGDAVWRESFDDDETLWVVDAGDSQTHCP